MIQQINETKIWLFENLNKINKTLTKLTKRRKENTQINKIRDGKEIIKTDTSEIQKIIQEYFENLCSSKPENQEIDKFRHI
jgi:hypothetical protein